MAFEIEHKFLLKNDNWRKLDVEKKLYQQAYVSTNSGTTVRVRIVGDDVAYLTLKGKRSGKLGISRTEFEYEIPVADAQLMIDEYVDSAVVKKYRYLIPYAGKVWELDEFLGDNAGLIVVEIELESEDEAFEKPEWVGECVSDDRRYGNAHLSRKPFNTWDK